MTAIREYPFDYSDVKSIEQPPPDYKTSTEHKMSTTILNNDRKLSPVPKKNSGCSSPSILCNGDRKVNNLERRISQKSNNCERKVSINENRTGRVSTHSIDSHSRRKSYLHNVLAADIDTSWDRSCHDGKFNKKHSTASTIHSRRTLSHHSEHDHDHVEENKSWWFAFCTKCHQEESHVPSWEPPYWQKFCPQPYCPSFRQMARLLILIMIGIIVWMNLWMIMGDTSAPGGQLFTLAVLTVSAHLAGVAVLKITTLPGLIGMLFMGILLKNIGFIEFNKEYQIVVSFIRKIALTILLIRAGMDLDPHAMSKHKWTVIKLSMIPWVFEFVLCAVMVHYLLLLPWDWALLLGSIIAAVSPAVVVPCLMRLRKKGFGVAKGIPTLVLAVSGIDDAASVAVFGIIYSVMFSDISLTMTIVQGVLSVVIGVLFGVILGYFVKFVPERNDSFLVPLRVLFLLFGGIVSMLGFDEIGWGGAGPLAVITFAFVACKNWGDLGWDFEDNPVVTAFEIFWMFFEPMLFGVTGAEVVIAKLPGHLVLIGGGTLVVCAILRAVITSTAAVRSNLNIREKVFVGVSWMAKATVQAALGPVALDIVTRKLGQGPMTTNPESLDSMKYAQIVMTICILSIIITAPIGAIVITVTGPRLLTRTTKPPILEGWRRSNRPSIRDISIIDEDEVAERNAELAEYIRRPRSPVLSLKEDTPTLSVKNKEPITAQPNNHVS